MGSASWWLRSALAKDCRSITAPRPPATPACSRAGCCPSCLPTGCWCSWRLWSVSGGCQAGVPRFTGETMMPSPCCAQPPGPMASPDDCSLLHPPCRAVPPSTPMHMNTRRCPATVRRQCKWHRGCSLAPQWRPCQHSRGAASHHLVPHRQRRCGAAGQKACCARAGNKAPLPCCTLNSSLWLPAAQPCHPHAHPLCISCVCMHALSSCG